MDRHWRNQSDMYRDLAEASGPRGRLQEASSSHSRQPIMPDFDLETQLYMTGEEDARAFLNLPVGPYPAPDFLNLQRMLQMLYKSEDLPSHNQTDYFGNYNHYKQDQRPAEELARLSLFSDETSRVVYGDHSVQGAQTSLNEFNYWSQPNYTPQLSYTPQPNYTPQLSYTAQPNYTPQPNYTQPAMTYAPFLGTITYKEKEQVSSTPYSQNAQSNQPTIPVLFTTGYKPSAYAAELYGKYQRDVYESAFKPKEDTWTKLQREMQERDAEFSRRAMEQERTYNWFEPKITQPPMTYAPYLGPTSYKQKEPVSYTPDFQIAGSSQSNIYTSLPKSYKPLSYDTERYKKFEKPAPVAHEDIWTKLQRKLEERDAELRKAGSEEEKTRSSPASVRDKKKKKFRGKRIL